MNHNEIGRDVVDRPTSLSLFLLLVLVAIPGASAGLYVVDVDLPPQNPVHNVVVTYSLPVGVIYKTGSFSASGASISSHQEVVSTPNDGSAPVTVTWTIESVYNTGNQDLEIQFDGIVANVTGNQDGVQLPPGTVSYTYDGGLGAKTGRSQPTEIVEPDLTILKRRSRETQGQVTFELMVYHTPKSHSDAHDVVITDVLPNNMRYVPNSIEIIAGPSGTTIVSGADLTWNFPLIGRSWESGNEVKLEYKANKGQTSSSTTPRTLVWTSAEGAGYGEDRFYTLRFNETVMIVSISCSAESVTVGKEITYTYTITNIGAARVDNVQLTNKSGSIIPLTPTPTSLETGESATGLENYIVQESDLPGPLVNTATVTGTDRYGRSVSAVGTISVPFGIDPLNVRKTALNKTVARGGNVTYIIEIENNGISGSDPPTNITVEDVFSMPVEILSASPPPGMDGLWRFPKIDPGSSEKITLVVRVPEKQDFNFTSVSGVSGSGFVNAASFYTTSLDPFPLKNCVYVTFFNSTFHDGTGTTGRNETISDCETVTVGRAGTELSTREHGSGAYESADLVKMVTKNDLISLEKDMAATYGATTLTLPRNRTVTYSSRWTGEAMAKNRVTGASMAESYRYATTLDRESKFFLNENESEMEIDAEFDGMAHIGFLKMPTNKSTFKATPIFESREDYAGSFRVIERVDEYGSAASSERSAEGLGLVAVDKRIGAVQRSYEHGTGAYSSEELIRTYTNYIAKEISLKYSPTGLRLTDGASANVSGKWKEGMSSASPGTSLIAEEYTSITELDKETVARGLNEMETEADFTGRARYRTIAKSGSWSGGGPIYIRDINFADEWVEIANRGDDVVNMTGWNLSDDDGHGWPFPYFVLCPGRSVRVHTFSGTDTGTDLFMNMDGPIWNDDGDCAILKDANGNLVDKKCTNDELGYEIDFDEIYEGDYSIARRILLSGAPKYDRPHLNVTKSLEGIEEEAVPWGRDEPHLPGEKKTRKVAAYAITIANDGNRALGPIRVQDLFPTGASYLRSSLRPTEVTAESCNWTLTHLAIGDVAEIEIELDVTGCPGPELINRVAVCGGEGGEGICAASSSVHEIGWLSWPSDEISAAKTEELDEAEEEHDEGPGACSGWSLPSWDFEGVESRAVMACEFTSDEEAFWLGP